MSRIYIKCKISWPQIAVVLEKEHIVLEMSASLNLILRFQGEEEMFYETKPVHGCPASSTRAELDGVIMVLDFAY